MDFTGFMVWVFHGFERFKDFAAAKDIYYANRSNALELDHEAEEESRKADRLKLKAHWYGFSPGASGVLVPGWQSRLIDLDELIWDSNTCKPYLISPEAEETAHLRERHKDWLAKFEAAWLSRHDKDATWRCRAFKRAWDCFTGFLSHRALPTYAEAEDHGFASALDQFYAIRDGRQHFGKQNVVGATNTLLEYRRGFTAALVAIARANHRDNLIDTPSVRAKVARNLGPDGGNNAAAQLHAYDPLIRLLFPEATTRLASDPGVGV